LALIGAAVMAANHHQSRSDTESDPLSDRGQPSANGPTPVYYACQDAVAAKVAGQRGRDSRAETDADYNEHQVSNAETGIRSRGQVQGDGGDWSQFGFECVFNVRTGRVSSTAVTF